MSLAIKFFLSLSLILLIPGRAINKKQYYKNYYENGKVKSEGWLTGKQKNGYWKFYFGNGKLEKEGHFKAGNRENYWYYYYEGGIVKKEGHYQKGAAVNWWIYYNRQGHIVHKCQLDHGVKNGYCLKYTNQKLSSAEKYSNGNKVDEWFNFSSFKKDNNISDLK